MFGHPSSNVIEKLENMNVRIFRTDEMGEVSIRVSDNKRIWVDKMLK